MLAGIAVAGSGLPVRNPSDRRLLWAHVEPACGQIRAWLAVDRENSEKLHKDAANLGDEIDELELRWLELHEALDALPSPD